MQVVSVKDFVEERVFSGVVLGSPIFVVIHILGVPDMLVRDDPDLIHLKYGSATLTFRGESEKLERISMQFKDGAPLESPKTFQFVDWPWEKPPTHEEFFFQFVPYICATTGTEGPHHIMIMRSGVAAHFDQDLKLQYFTYKDSELGKKVLAGLAENENKFQVSMECRYVPDANS
jgi:hypothetical protein